MSISVNGFNENVLTFKTDALLNKGDVVKISKNDTVAPCASGNSFCGVVCESEKNYAGVQLKGFVKVKYSGSAPALGMTSLVADGTGRVKTGEGGIKYLVSNVDTSNTTVCFML